MRAKEFTINVPITIKFSGDGDPEVTTQDSEKSGPVDQADLATNFVPPLQQKIELMKGAAGKSSDVFDQITADDDNEAS
jgi:hypothetical protein